MKDNRVFKAIAELDDDIIMEVCDSMKDTKKHINRAKIIRTTLIAAVVTALLAVTAYAVGTHAGFFNTAFGTGVEGHDAYTIPKGSDSYESYPAVERVDVDEDKAESLVGDYVEDSGLSTTVAGNTFTVESYVFDENGIGVITVSIDNPDGLNDSDSAYSFSPYMDYVDEENTGYMLDDRWYLDTASKTDTHAVYAVYVTPFDDAAVGRDITLIFKADTDEYETINGKEYPIPAYGQVTIPTSDAVKSISCSVGEFEVSVSPIGMKLVTSTGDTDNKANDIVITYADGTEYVAVSDDVYNLSVGSMDDDTTIWFAFNRLVDIDEIASVSIDGVTATVG